MWLPLTGDPKDQEKLLEAARFMDSNECKTIISAGRDTVGKSVSEILAAFKAVKEFNKSAESKFGRKGEW
jgi:4-hydroxy-4-methyl-2-oxoglutarate aldolase